MSDSKELTALCNAVDRSFLSDRLPYPYTEEDAKAWLNMVAQNESVTGIYRAIVMDGQPIGQRFGSNGAEHWEKVRIAVISIS